MDSMNILHTFGMVLLLLVIGVAFGRLLQAALYWLLVKLTKRRKISELKKFMKNCEDELCSHNPDMLFKDDAAMREFLYEFIRGLNKFEVRIQGLYYGKQTQLDHQLISTMSNYDLVETIKSVKDTFQNPKIFFGGAA